MPPHKKRKETSDGVQTYNLSLLSWKLFVTYFLKAWTWINQSQIVYWKEILAFLYRARVFKWVQLKLPKQYGKNQLEIFIAKLQLAMFAASKHQKGRSRLCVKIVRPSVLLLLCHCCSFNIMRCRLFPVTAGEMENILFFTGEDVAV